MNKNNKSKENTILPHINNRISILSKRIYKLKNMYADICEQYGMWSYQSDRCDKIIEKANNELMVLYNY